MKENRVLLSGTLALLLVCPAYAENVIELQPILITGARMAQVAGQSGANVTVLGKDDIVSSGATDTAELIASAGATFLTRKSTSKQAVIDVRGYGDTADRNILILLNGRKVNSVDNAGFDFSSIPLDTIEKIEVVHGAGSVLYGDNAVGGVINIIIKEGKGSAHGSVGATLGSYSSRKQFLEASGSGQKISYFLSSSYAQDNGYRSNSDVTAKDFSTRIGYKVSDRLSFDTDIRWHEDHYGLPGGLNDAGLGTYGRRGSDEEDNYGDTKDRTFGVITTIHPWKDPAINGELTVDYSFRNQDSYGWYDYGTFGAYATKRSIDTHALFTKYTHKGEVSSHHWNIVTGLDLYDANNDILGSGKGAYISHDDLTISKKEIGAYGYGEFEIVPKVFAGGGIRYQHADYTFDQRSGTPSYTGRDPSATVKKGLIRYEYARRSNIYASAEETFRFLSTDEWYNTYTGLDTTLRQQTGIQYEIGWKHDFNDYVETSVVPYWIVNDHEIFFDPTIGAYGANKNYDETLRRGIELASTFDLRKILNAEEFKKLTLKTDYNFQKAVFRDGVFAGNDIPLVPRQQAHVNLSAQWNNGFGIAFTETAVGSRYVINDTLNQVKKEKAYFLTDLKFFFTKKKWEMFFAVNNLFSKKYNDYAARSVSDPTDIEYYPASERNFEMGVKIKF